MNDGKIYAINGETGALIANYNNKEGFTGSAVIVNDAIYAVSKDNYIHSISLKNGKLLWRIKISDAKYYLDNTISICQGLIFISTPDNNICIIGDKNNK